MVKYNKLTADEINSFRKDIPSLITQYFKEIAPTIDELGNTTYNLSVNNAVEKSGVPSIVIRPNGNVIYYLWSDYVYESYFYDSTDDTFSYSIDYYKPKADFPTYGFKLSIDYQSFYEYNIYGQPIYVLDYWSSPQPLFEWKIQEFASGGSDEIISYICNDGVMSKDWIENNIPSQRAYGKYRRYFTTEQSSGSTKLKLLKLWESDGLIFGDDNSLGYIIIMDSDTFHMGRPDSLRKNWVSGASNGTRYRRIRGAKTCYAPVSVDTIIAQSSGDSQALILESMQKTYWIAQ